MVPIKVAETGDLAPGTGRVVEVEGKMIALFHLEGTFYAMENGCTHRGGPLGEGWLGEDGIVTCPLHGARFDIRTGEALGPPAPSGVKTYKVEVQGEDIIVHLD